MDMVFVYEDKIARDTAGNYYVGSAFSQEVFDRYLQHFDHITLLMRRADVAPDDAETLSRMNRIDTSKIDVVILPNLTSNLKNFLSIKLRSELKKRFWPIYSRTGQLFCVHRPTAGQLLLITAMNMESPIWRKQSDVPGTAYGITA